MKVYAMAQVGVHLSLYTNSDAFITIQIDIKWNTRIEVIDIAYKVIYPAPGNISTTRYSQVIKVSAFSPGIYILQLNSNSQNIHSRLVVAR